MRLVCSRFLDIKEDDLMEGDEFFSELDSGMYDEA
jgi:HTH-type transcriptional regulator/antitoxin HigA